jgi:hypothetical protein
MSHVLVMVIFIIVLTLILVLIVCDILFFVDCFGCICALDIVIVSIVVRRFPLTVYVVPLRVILVLICLPPVISYIRIYMLCLWRLTIQRSLEFGITTKALSVWVKNMDASW